MVSQADVQRPERGGVAPLQGSSLRPAASCASGARNAGLARWTPHEAGRATPFTVTGRKYALVSRFIGSLRKLHLVA